jgi:hypothetical protein
MIDMTVYSRLEGSMGEITRRTFPDCMKMLNRSLVNILIMKQDQQSVLQSAGLFDTIDAAYYQLLDVYYKLQKLPVTDEVTPDMEVK